MPSTAEALDEPEVATGFKHENKGYQRAVAEMSSRFDPNNRELNKRKFAEQTERFVSKKPKMGAKFTNKLDLELSPDPHNSGSNHGSDGLALDRSESDGDRDEEAKSKAKSAANEPVDLRTL